MIDIIPFLTVYYTIIAFLLGSVMASFLGCMGWRMCKGESVLKGRSHCDVCSHVLGARDLIPVLSYLMSKGRCRYCGAKISPLNFYGELSLGILFGVVTFIYGHPFQLEYVVVLFFFSVLYLVTVTDIYEHIIPDGAIITAIVVKVVSEIPAHWHEILGILIDGLAVSLPLLILVLIMEKILKKEAMGGGDIKLLFVTGLYLGWARNILVIFFACIIGIIVGSMQQRKMITEEEDAEETFYFPFGPSIAVSAVLVFFIGEPILNWYLSLM